MKKEKTSYLLISFPIHKPRSPLFHQLARRRFVEIRPASWQVRQGAGRGGGRVSNNNPLGIVKAVNKLHWANWLPSTPMNLFSRLRFLESLLHPQSPITNTWQLWAASFQKLINFESLVQLLNDKSNHQHYTLHHPRLLNLTPANHCHTVHDRLLHVLHHPGQPNTIHLIFNLLQSLLLNIFLQTVSAVVIFTTWSSLFSSFSSLVITLSFLTIH